MTPTHDRAHARAHDRDETVDGGHSRDTGVVGPQNLAAPHPGGSAGAAGAASGGPDDDPGEAPTDDPADAGDAPTEASTDDPADRDVNPGRNQSVGEARVEDAGGVRAKGMADDSPNDLVADLAASQLALAELTADLQRLQAEYVNYKRRVDRDRELVKENARYSVLSALLPVLDDIDRAREHGEVEGGFKAVADSLERAVAGLGMVKFGEPGEQFDPNIHEALMHSYSPDVTTTTCQQIVQAGYRIGPRVVRPARVIVVDPEPTADGDGDGGSEGGSDADGGSEGGSDNR